MKILYFLLALSISAPSFSQITIGTETLPEVGDVIEYYTFFGFEGSDAFKDQGENLSWVYKEFEIEESEIESFEDIEGHPLQDSFPNADMIVNLGFFEAAAIKTESTIEVVGIVNGGFDEFGDIDFDAKINLDDNFIIRRAPIEYKDSFEDGFDFTITLGSEIIPFLDSLELPIPGASLDSIRVTNTLESREEVTAWGTLELLGNELEVLKVEQTDMTEFTLEIGLGVFGNTIWLDASDFFDAGDFLMDGETTTYKFLAPNFKGPILEFNEETIVDSISTEIVVAGRVSSEFITSVKDNNPDFTTYKVVPNPAQNSFRISSETTNNIDRVILFDQMGRVVQSINDYKVNTSISIIDLPTGNYTAVLLSNEALKTLKIVKN